MDDEPNKGNNSNIIVLSDPYQKDSDNNMDDELTSNKDMGDDYTVSYNIEDDDDHEFDDGEEDDMNDEATSSKDMYDGDHESEGSEYDEECMSSFIDYENERPTLSSTS